MAYNTGDTAFYIVKETAAGTTPANPAFKRLAHKEGSSSSYEEEQIVSEIVSADRERKTVASVKGKASVTLETELRKDDANDLLLESALSGTFTSNVLKAGKTDTSMTVETIYDAGASKDYTRHTGCQVTGVTIKGDYGSFISYSFTLAGLAEGTSSTILTGATYADDSTNPSLDGGHMVTITIGGVEYEYTSFELTATHDRVNRYKMGQVASTGLGFSGFREGMLSLTVPHNPTLRTAMASAPVAVSLTLGGVGNGYTFLLPRAYPNKPKIDTVDAAIADTYEFMFTRDATEGTGLKVTRL